MKKSKPHQPEFDSRVAPLVWACAEGDLKKVRSLIKSGLSVNAIGDKKWGYYPLHAAAEKGHASVVKCLLDTGASIEIQTRAEIEQKRDTPLLLATEKGHEKAVEILLTAGADANGSNLLKNTPLGFAIANQNEPMVKLLLKHGAKVEWKHIRTAVKKGARRILEILVEKGGELVNKDPNGSDSLLSNAVACDQIDMLEHLLEPVMHFAQAGGEK